MIVDADGTLAIVYGGICWKDCPGRVRKHLLENQIEGGVPGQSQIGTHPIVKGVPQLLQQGRSGEASGPRKGINVTRVELKDQIPSLVLEQ